jgi:hypothetical protein
MPTNVWRQHDDENAVYYATYAISSYNICITNITIKMATVIFKSKINYTGFKIIIIIIIINGLTSNCLRKELHIGYFT